jgi:hypothetical protein
MNPCVDQCPRESKVTVQGRLVSKVQSGTDKSDLGKLVNEG